MAGKSKFKSPANEAIHSAASGLFSVDAISLNTMQRFNAVCIDILDTRCNNVMTYKGDSAKIECSEGDHCLELLNSDFL